MLYRPEFWFELVGNLEKLKERFPRKVHCDKKLFANFRIVFAGHVARLAVLDELGPYFVIAPGIAIAHARPSESVVSAGLSLAVLATPIEFGSDHNDPVRMVFGLCAKDHDGHIEVLSGLAEMLSDDAQVNFLLNASDAGRIHEYLASGL